MKKSHTLQRRVVFLGLIVLWFAAGIGILPVRAQEAPVWKIHDPQRPQPRVVTPAPQAAMAAPPPGAIILFDGSDLSGWCDENGEAATWTVQDGAMVRGPRGGDVFTERAFGDIQLHLEWSSPLPASGQGQGRGNSGVFLMGLYEVQILDSFQNATYPDGQAAALYGQHPPLANACRAPGEWQTYDIVFRRPRFQPDGRLAAPACVTVIHNGILVQDAAEFWGPTMWLQHLPYANHPDRLPLSLQDHGNPVRFRNIWARELRETNETGPMRSDSTPVIFLTPQALERYIGIYKFSPSSKSSFDIVSDGKQLTCIFGEERARVDLVPHSTTRFSLRWTAAHIDFMLNDDEEGRATAMTFNVAGSAFTIKRVE